MTKIYSRNLNCIKKVFSLKRICHLQSLTYKIHDFIAFSSIILPYNTNRRPKFTIKALINHKPDHITRYANIHKIVIH